MRNKEYKDFSLQIHEKGCRRPLMGQFELTFRCNLRCQHCNIVNDSKKKELTCREFLRIIDEIHQEGCLWLCLTGGEPLLRGDFLDIYSYARKKGFILTIFTNATLLNTEMARYLKRFPPFCIEVTLNGVTKKTYELISQAPGSFEKAMRGIELIRSYGLPFKLKCQEITLNVKEVPLLREFYKRMGVKFISGILIEPRINGATEPCSLRLPVDKLPKYKDLQICRSTANSNKLFHCPGGTWAFYVNPYGELFLCDSVRNPSWDLRKHPFRKGFYDFFAKIRSAEFKTNSPCRTCSLRKYCLWCPGRAYLETDDREAPIPYYCELTKLSQIQQRGAAVK